VRTTRWIGAALLPFAAVAGACDDDGGGGEVEVDDDAGPIESMLAFATDPLTAAIDAATGDADSLADDEAPRAVARALDEAGALSAIVTPDIVATGTILEPYVALGTGVRRENGEAQMVVVLEHDSEAAAEENAERFEVFVTEGEPPTRDHWDELADVVSVDTDGTTMVAVLEDLDSPTLWASSVYQRSSLYATS
jgi:hypothetical protein